MEDITKEFILIYEANNKPYKLLRRHPYVSDIYSTILLFIKTKQLWIKPKYDGFGDEYSLSLILEWYGQCRSHDYYNIEEFDELDEFIEEYFEYLL